MSELSITSLNEKPDLAETCAAWSFGEWACHEPGRTLEKTITRYKKTAASKNSDLPKTWIGTVQKKPAGMISLKQYDHIDITELSPWVASFFIHPAFRGQGYAHKLLECIQHEAQKLQYKIIYLFTADAQNLYIRHGWEAFDTVRDPLEIHPHVTLMRKSL